MERVEMAIAITAAIDSKGKIGQWALASPDIPILGSLAWCQQRINCCRAITKVLDQRRMLAVAKLPGSRST
jgi:hypothetical protein